MRSRWLPQITSADWPSLLGILRDLSVLVFLAFAAHWFAAAVRDEVHARRQGPVAGSRPDTGSDRIG